MKKIIVLSVLFVCLSFGLESAQARPAPDGFADLVEELLPTVVNISTSHTVESGGVLQGMPRGNFPPGHPFEQFNDFFGQFDGAPKDGSGARKEKLTSLGSGFVISADGLVVTNYHVIENADEVMVTFHDKSQYSAKVIGHDAKTDLAVLRLEMDGEKKKIPFAKFGNSDTSRVGDWVIAIGNPFNLGGTVTAGIISARSRDINSGPFDNFIQTDAAINRGNSGGPMFNLSGEVIGINSAIYSPSGGSVGIGFAIPSSMAQPIIKQLGEGKEIKRGWLGVKIQTVTKEIAESLGIEKEKGALVVEVVEDSPAASAGFEKGDIILEFDGKEIVTMRRLPRIVAETEIGKEVSVKIIRNGKNKNLTVDLGKLKEDEKENGPTITEEKNNDEHSSTKEVIGMKLVVVNDEWRDKYKLDKDARGVLVVSVDAVSEAYTKGVRRGDIIVEVNQQKVKNIDDIRLQIKATTHAGRKAVLLYVNRGDEYQFIAVPIDEK